MPQEKPCLYDDDDDDDDDDEDNEDDEDEHDNHDDDDDDDDDDDCFFKYFHIALRRKALLRKIFPNPSRASKKLPEYISITLEYSNI